MFFLVFYLDNTRFRKNSYCISVNIAKIPDDEIDRISLDETSDIGEDTSTPVNLSYDVPHRFSGRLGKVVFSLGEAAVSFEDLLNILREQHKGIPEGGGRRG
jgi:hypothetical protein